MEMHATIHNNHFNYRNCSLNDFGKIIKQNSDINFIVTPIHYLESVGSSSQKHFHQVFEKGFKCSLSFEERSISVRFFHRNICFIRSVNFVLFLIDQFYSHSKCPTRINISELANLIQTSRTGPEQDKSYRKGRRNFASMMLRELPDEDMGYVYLNLISILLLVVVFTKCEL